MGKKKSYNDIPSLLTDWANDPASGLPFAGQKVQEFIKKQFNAKVGYWCWSSEPDVGGFYHLWGFATKDARTEYLADPEGNAGLLLVNEALPISAIKGDSYNAYLWTDVLSTNEYIVSGDSLKVHLRFSSVRTSNGDRLNLGSAGTLVVQRKTSNTDWTTVATLKAVMPSTDYSDTSNYTDIELGGYLVSGKQQLRVRASVDYTDDTGEQKTATSTYVAIGSSITKTNLDIVCQQNWQTPIMASTYKDKGYPISYMVYGAVAKTLHVEVTGGNSKTLSLEYALTADQDSATITKNVADSTDTYKLWQHGVRTVKAWLTADDGQGGEITSQVLVNRFMVVNPTTDADKTTQATVPAFRPGAFAITAKNIEKLSLNGCTASSGNIDLSALSRLQTVDVRNTKLAEVTLPETPTLTEVQLPATATSVVITNNPTLKTLTLEGYQNLTKYVVKNNTNIDTHVHVVGIYNAKAPVKTLAVENVNWTGSEVLNTDMMMWLANIPASLTGVIELKKASQDRYMTINEKITLGKVYGNIDDKNNALYITYTLLAINTLSIVGTTFMTKTGEYQFSLLASPVNGNNIAVDENGAKLKWTLPTSAEPYAHWVDDVNGLLSVDALSDPDLDQKHTMSVTAGLTTGSTLTAEKQVGFYRHTPKVGDFAYADGTFDSEWDASCDFVGLVFMRLPLYDEDDSTKLIGYDVRVVSKENLTLTSTDKGNTWAGHRWGLNPNDFSSVETDIEEASGVVDAFDIYELANITTADGKNASFTISDTTFLDDTQTDGYKVFTVGAASDFNGKSNTQKIVNHVKKIVSGYLGKSWPTTMTELADAMQAIIKENASATNSGYYDEFYYPAGWGCALYEPTVKNGTVADEYKAGNWYLPACGELCRIYNFYRLGTTADKANFDADNEATTPIIANAASKAKKSVMNAYSDWVWTSSERSYGGWFATGSGYVNGGGYKSSNYAVRPCSAFTFLL